MQRVDVYILAGGGSRRFGSDKARAMLGGRALIMHVAAALRPIARRMTVIAAEAGAYDDLGLATIGDVRPGLGPLGGLHTAIEAMRDHGDGWFVMASCDFARVRVEWVRALIKRCDDADVGAIAFRGEGDRGPGRWQPMPGLYHAERLRALVARRLESGDRSMQGLLTEAGATAAALPADWPARAGVNTRDELGSDETCDGDRAG